MACLVGHILGAIMKLELVESVSKINSNVTFDSNIKKQIDELAKKLKINQSTVINALCLQGLKSLNLENKAPNGENSADIKLF